MNTSFTPFHGKYHGSTWLSMLSRSRINMVKPCFTSRPQELLLGEISGKLSFCLLTPLTLAGSSKSACYALAFSYSVLNWIAWSESWNPSQFKLYWCCDALKNDEIVIWINLLVNLSLHNWRILWVLGFQLLEHNLALLKVGIVKGTFSGSHSGTSSRFKPGFSDPPSHTLGGVLRKVSLGLRSQSFL